MKDNEAAQLDFSPKEIPDNLDRECTNKKFIFMYPSTRGTTDVAMFPCSKKYYISQGYRTDEVLVYEPHPEIENNFIAKYSLTSSFYSN